MGKTSGGRVGAAVTVARMCTYAFVHYKLHFVCVDCRFSGKRHPRDDGRPHPCPRCGEPMANAGHDFAAPRRDDTRAWRAVAATLAAGLRYEGFEPCGCGREPRFRPRTSAEVRARRRVAERTGTPLPEVLGRPDPWDADSGGADRAGGRRWSPSSARP